MAWPAGHPYREEVIVITLPQRPRRPGPGQAVTAIRRALSAIRPGRRELLLAREAMFRRAGAPQPSAGSPANRATDPVGHAGPPRPAAERARQPA